MNHPRRARLFGILPYGRTAYATAVQQRRRATRERKQVIRSLVRKPDRQRSHRKRFASRAPTAGHFCALPFHTFRRLGSDCRPSTYCATGNYSLIAENPPHKSLANTRAVLRTFALDQRNVGRINVNLREALRL
jgi:hypothetical protein